MHTKIKAVLKIWDDEDERIPLFAPPEDRFLELIVNGYQEYSSGRFKLAGTETLAIPFGSVATPRVLFLRIEGADGADVTINGGTARQIRPATDDASAAESTPAALYLETSDDLTSVEIAHPGDADADAIAGFWVLVGDAAA